MANCVKFWEGAEPNECELCLKKIKDIFVDGKTKFGPWAMLCPTCHSNSGAGLGVGRGQKYVKSESGQWVKEDC
jgi:hypothetical protein